MTTSYLRHDLDLASFASEFQSAKPFNHIVIDNFFAPEVAEKLADEFPKYNDAVWHEYNNPIEVKRVMNSWDKFPPTTYSVLTYLNSPEFLLQLEPLLGTGEKLIADYGMNGAGRHCHQRGGKLNFHLDYSLHPKLGKERRLNLIVWLTPSWDPAWGGQLGLLSGDDKRPDELVKQVDPVYGRAIIFDTTQNSWHGIVGTVQCPEGVTRNSLAMYYLTEPRVNAPSRGRAQFVPTKEQENDRDVLQLIERRSKEGGVFV